VRVVEGKVRVGFAVFVVGALSSVLGAECTPASAPNALTAPIPSLAGPRLAADATEPPRAGVRFERRPASVGARTHVTVRAESRWEDAQSQPQESIYESDFEVEVLAVAGPAPSRVRVRFDTNQSRYQGLPRPTSIHQKTFLVDVVPPYVRDASGAAAPEEQAQRVLDVFPDLGTRARIDEALPDEPIAIGETRDALAAAILRILHPRIWIAETTHATLERFEGASGEAVFALAIDAASRETSVRLALTGEARIVARESRLTSIVLHGAYEVGDAGAPGTFRYERRIRADLGQ
jgi:hypothetical protein